MYLLDYVLSCNNVILLLNDVIVFAADFKYHCKIQYREEQQAILQKLNTASDEELSHYSRLTKQKASDLVSYRTDHGHFEKLSDLVQVKGFGPTLLNSICRNIVNNKMSKSSTAARYVIDRIKAHPRYISNQVSV